MPIRPARPAPVNGKHTAFGPRRMHNSTEMHPRKPYPPAAPKPYDLNATRRANLQQQNENKAPSPSPTTPNEKGKETSVSPRKTVPRPMSKEKFKRTMLQRSLAQSLVAPEQQEFTQQQKGAQPRREPSFQPKFPGHLSFTYSSENIQLASPPSTPTKGAVGEPSSDAASALVQKIRKHQLDDHEKRMLERFEALKRQQELLESYHANEAALDEAERLQASREDCALINESASAKRQRALEQHRVEEEKRLNEQERLQLEEERRIERARLHEAWRIEQERLKEERRKEEERKARLAAEQKAKEEQEMRRKAAEEARKRAEEERQRRQQLVEADIHTIYEERQNATELLREVQERGRLAREGLQRPPLSLLLKLEDERALATEWVHLVGELFDLLNEQYRACTEQRWVNFQFLQQRIQEVWNCPRRVALQDRIAALRVDVAEEARVRAFQEQLRAAFEAQQREQQQRERQQREQQERAERARREQAERAAREAWEREERARREAAERAARQQSSKTREQLCDQYDERWAIMSKANADGSLPSGCVSYADFPLPIFTPNVLPADITHDAVREFVLSPFLKSMADKPPKRRIRATLLLWHPDKFEGTYLRTLRDADRDTMKEAVKIISGILNDLLAQVR